MRFHLPGRDEHGESGAIAIMMALLAVVVFGAAALAIDTTSQVNQRQKLHDSVDAAAHAGAYRLPGSGAAAMTDAAAFATANDPTAPTPAVALFCVVASVAGAPDTSQIPATCNPASARVGLTSVYTGTSCNSTFCSIPCSSSPSAVAPATVPDMCNTVRVTDTKVVPFSFGRVIGVNQGGTGSVTSAACKGSCGTISPNPMDVAVVADRTGSMSSTDINAMITGIKSMFQVMTPSQQYVSLGTIGWSDRSAPANCKSLDEASSPTSSTDTNGTWLPVPFSNNYLNLGTTTINTSSPLVQAVNCLTNSSGTGTHLAAPLKAAARFLLGPSAPYDTTSNIGLLPSRSGTPRKAIIFETDGAPNEKFTGGTVALNTTGVIGSTSTTTDAACTNFKNVASAAKTAGILMVTVAFNVTTSDKCSSAGGSVNLDDTLASGASDKSLGVPSAAQFDCGTSAGRDAENGDLDMFFCAGSGTDMAPIFKTAFGSLSTGIRLIQLP